MRSRNSGVNTRVFSQHYMKLVEYWDENSAVNKYMISQPGCTEFSAVRRRSESGSQAGQGVAVGVSVKGSGVSPTVQSGWSSSALANRLNVE
jgi:hypothetical protein